MKKNYIYVVQHPMPGSGFTPDGILLAVETMGASTDLNIARSLCQDPTYFVVRVEDGKTYTPGSAWPKEDVEWPAVQQHLQ